MWLLAACRSVTADVLQVETAEIQRLKKIIAELESGKKVTNFLGKDENSILTFHTCCQTGREIAEETEQGDGDGGTDAAQDDAKYLHGPDFEQNEGEEEVPSEGAKSSGGALQASKSALAPAFDEEDPDNH